jgi:hypothetical protein
MRTKGENKHQGCQTNCNPLDTNNGFIAWGESQTFQLWSVPTRWLFPSDPRHSVLVAWSKKHEKQRRPA